MCLILFALDHHPDYPFICAANRDEDYARPTAPAAFWENAPGLLGGKDLVFGGTWLGVTRKGRFAALTNYRDPASFMKFSLSRGLLVSDALRAGDSPPERIRQISKIDPAYNGYNLLLGEPGGLWYHSNRLPGSAPRIEPGVHGLSNSFLDVPWPKVEKGKKRLAAALEEGPPDPETLFNILADDEPAPDEALPHTGVTFEREKMLSPMFIKSAGYGTCSSSVVLVGRDGRARFWERSFAPATGAVTGEVSFEFDIEP